MARNQTETMSTMTRSKFGHSVTATEQEIERQWKYHLFVRAAFPCNAERKTTWDTESEEYRFYSDRGARLKVTLATPLPTGVQDIGHWLNQNCLIRLCGILEQHGVVKATAGQNDCIAIVDL